MRTGNGRRRRPARQTPQRGSFLLVTLAQCTLCAVMLAVAYCASNFFGMTDLKPVFAALLTQKSDAQQTLAQMRTFWDEAGQEIPAGVLSEKLVFSAPMLQPVMGALTSAYGLRKDPISGKTDFHTGVDVAAAEGSPVRAAYPGVVEEVGMSEIYGNYVVLRHGNFHTRYCHCLCSLVREGEFVSAGERIALVGSTGRATGPHLHLELLVDGRAADPLDAAEGWTWL